MNNRTHDAIMASMNLGEFDDIADAMKDPGKRAMFEASLKIAKVQPPADPEMQTYIVRASETRVHEFRVVARSEAEAMAAIAEGNQDFSDSISEQFDSMEVMDAILESVHVKLR